MAILDIILWLAAIEVIGFAAFPLVFVIFRRFDDRGYAFSKPLGLLFLVYPIWLTGSLGIIPAGKITAFLALTSLILLGLFVARKNAKQMRIFFIDRWRILLIGEAIFLVFFLGWTLYRTYDPIYTHTEQPMDFAFLNASILATKFPPMDPWLSGNTISYYYFGSLINAIVAKIAFVSAPVAYNLGLSLVAGLTALTSYGLIHNLALLTKLPKKLAIIAALTAPLLVLVIGNLEGFLELAIRQNWGAESFWQWLNIKNLTPLSDTGLIQNNHWWWWNASRLLSPALESGYQETISEFPFFSLLLGDLHPHLMALPYGLLVLAFSLNLISTNKALTFAWLKANPFYLALVGLSLGALGFINIWDLPTYGAIFVVSAVIASSRSNGSTQFSSRTKAFLQGFGFAATTVGLSIVFYFPFYSSLSTQVSGISVVITPVSRLPHQIIFWGPLMFIVTTVAIFQMWVCIRTSGFAIRKYLIILTLNLLPIAIWGVFASDITSLGERFFLLLPWLFILSCLIYGILARLKDTPENFGTIYALVLASFGILLIIGPELFFVVDFFGTRMNTLFKFYYQAWILLALTSAWGLGYIMYRVRSTNTHPISRHNRQSLWILWSAVLIILLASSLYYPIAAIHSKASELLPLQIRTLNGLEILRISSPEEYEAIQWLADNANNTDVIVEASGNSYSNNGRISAFTGIPTILGWIGHELQWRGSTSAFEGRAKDIGCIYSCEDIEQIRNLLQKYSVTYVVVGKRERQTYQKYGALPDFESFLPKVEELKTKGIRIYRVPR